MAGPERSSQADSASRPRDPLSIAAIMPLYNGRAWVEQAIGSILAQTLAPDEIIIIDDGSTDDGPEFVREIAKNHPTMRVISQPNAGQSAARNTAIGLCRSDWIALIDQDDMWYPNHLEMMVEAVQDHQGLRLGWAYSDFDDIDLDGRLIMRNFVERTAVDNPKRDLVRVLSQGFIIQPSATLINRAAILEVGGFDEHLSGYEDDDLFLRIFLANYDNVFLAVPTSQWRIHETSSGASERTEESLRYYSRKLIDAFPNDRWRGVYYRSDVLAPRFISTWIQMYVRASRFKNRAKMRMYAREASTLVRYLRPRARVTMTATLLLLRQPLFIRLRVASADERSISWAAMRAVGRRIAGM